MKHRMVVTGPATASLFIVVGLISLLGESRVANGAEFFCSSGNVTCLIAAINEANTTPGKHSINLEPGVYTLQAVDNTTDGTNGLPSIKGSILIRVSSDNTPTVIERDPAAREFRVFHVSVGGELSLEGVTVQRGLLGGLGGPAIFNGGGIISVRDSKITNNIGEGGAIVNFEGKLHLFKTIVTDNFNAHEAGGIFNLGGGIGNGTALIEFSTIAHNGADGAGGIQNRGTMVVRNSSIVFNRSVGAGSGAGIANVLGGNLEIINSTIAKNIVASFFQAGGGGIGISSGLVSITNSTIRENEVRGDGSGGGIWNIGGATTVQNTIIAGNVVSNRFGAVTGFDCSGMVTSIGSNIFGDPSGCTVNLQPTDLTGDPGLGALVGTEEDALPGKTYYPVLAGSPVIDKGNPNACPQTDQLGEPRIGVCDIGAIEFQSVLSVALDVKSGSAENTVNPKSKGVVPVAILGSNSFDASTVDQASLRFGPGQALAQGSGQLEDMNGDGQPDLVLHFRTQDSGIQCGDTSVSITGETVEGIPIQGSDTIRTVGCKASASKKK